MITNLLASVIVTIATNTTEHIEYERYVDVPNFSVLLTNPPIYPGPTREGINPQRKIVTTQAVKTTVLKFDWLGQEQRRETSEILWATNVVHEFKWVAGQPTAAPKVEAFAGSYVFTNRTGLFVTP